MKTMTKKMTKAQTRVAIAKDVLKQLKVKTIVPANNSYCHVVMKSPKENVWDDKYKGEDLRDILQTRAKRCEVCAKGAMFIAHVLRFNKVRNSFWGFGDVDVTEPLLLSFSRNQLDLIEAVYERWKTELNERAIRFIALHPSRHDRLVAIMRNIIKNNGTFRP